MITIPTIGRIVWYYPSPEECQEHNDTRPGAFEFGKEHAAVVAAVSLDGRRIAVSVLDRYGVHWPRQSVWFQQPTDVVVPAEPVCQWMPYQIGQAAKTEKLEAELASQKVPRMADQAEQELQAAVADNISKTQE